MSTDKHAAKFQKALSYQEQKRCCQIPVAAQPQASMNEEVKSRSDSLIHRRYQTIPSCAEQT